MGLFSSKKQPPTVLAKGTKARDLLVRRDRVVRLIQLEDATHEATHRIDEGPEAERRFHAADRAYQKALKASTPAERKAAENAVNNPPWRKR